MKSYTKRFPIVAGMPFNGSFTGMKKIGYYVVKFNYSLDGQLISEETIKRVTY